MTPGQRQNLKRLLAPRHIAVIGGAEAAVAARLSLDAGFDGPLWGVNPGRATLGGQPCFPHIEALPTAPDAVFLAVPRRAAIESLKALSDLGAGGVVCYTAGFRELGAAGAPLEAELIAAAGELALVGPNCYGLLNYVRGAALWPYAHGGGRVERGSAIISQSGMLASNLTMGRRGLPFAYVISAGNQSVLGVEDYLEVLIGDPAITGVGLYVEELRDVPRFAEAALGALAAGIPIVALKAGRSELGARLTESHTGSLSGADEVYQALFDRLGILRVESPAQLLETLKMLTIAGVPKGPRLAGFTCSGGDALMLADGAEAAGLVFRQPSPDAARELAGRLPVIATVSNPLDYTTPLWGDGEELPKVFATMLSDGYDAALLVQDYPAPDLDADKTSYLSDCRAFMAAARAAGIPAAVASSVPENLDRETRETIAAAGGAPLQGVGEALSALGQAARHGARRARIEADPAALRLPAPPPLAGAPESLDEWAGKRWLAAAGIPLPEGRLVDAAGAEAAAAEIGFPVVVKAVSPRLAHKTEAGAVALDLADGPAVTAAVAAISRALAQHDPESATGKFLVERMVGGVVAELLIGIRRDPRFGLVMVLASGGLLVELVGDSRTLLLPAGREELSDALDSLKVAKQIAGYRGRPAGDRAAVLEVLVMLADFAQTRAARIAEVEINPLLVTQEGAFAVDVLLRAVPGDLES